MNRKEYESRLKQDLQEAREIAENAKQNGDDPEKEIEIPIAKDMAERCETLLEKEYGNKVHGLAEHIRELEKDDDIDSREAMGLVLAEEYATGDLSEDFDNDAERAEAAIRTAAAILTEGIVAAPIEGIGNVKVEDNDDGTKFLRVPFFGPIRSAGGTAQALSVLVADYVRHNLDLDRFKPRDDEIERYAEEIHLYNSAKGMQYCPPKDEIRFIIENTPVMVDGQPNPSAVDKEVDGYRDLERIDGNHPRDGMSLVIAEGLALKSPKILRYSEAFELDTWDWLEDLIGKDESEEKDEAEHIKLYSSPKSQQNEHIYNRDWTKKAEWKDGEWITNNTNKSLIETDDPQEILEEYEEYDLHAFTPDEKPLTKDELEIPTRMDEINVLDKQKKYIKDVIAGRPIFAGPSQKGAFRLRYGRARNTGLAAVGFSPATMVICDNFIASGTQLKTERPGKAAGAAPVDSIEGPTVRLKSGEVKRIDTEKEAKEKLEQVEKIIDLGEIAVPYGEFVENNHQLAPASYTVEWWKHEVDTDKIDQDITDITAKQALELSLNHDFPLHPEYTYLWHDINPTQYAALKEALDQKQQEDNKTKLTKEIKIVLEELLVPHTTDEEHIYIDTNIVTILEHCVSNNPIDDDVLGQVNNTAPFDVRARSPTRIGTRMGRPEKAERREMKPVVHSLFPIENAGGDQRKIVDASKDTTGSNESIPMKNKRGKKQKKQKENDYSGRGVIKTRLANRVCKNCKHQTWKLNCPKCDHETEVKLACSKCNTIAEKHQEQCKNCGSTSLRHNTLQELDVNTELRNAFENLQERETSFNVLKGVKKLTAKHKIPEPIDKGILRAKHNVSVFRDGTSRYDMVDLPLTSFKPKEIDITVEKLKQLGYETDLNGDRIENDEQIIELKIQDLIISKDGGEYLLKVANYIDDLLEKYYDTEPFYNADTPEDLIGEQLLGMAPHTSAATLGRLIGYTDASAGYAHPFYHAAKRRNCFHPDTTLNVKINGSWQETTIGDLVETYLTDDADDEYDDGSIVQDISDHPDIEEMKVPSMNDSGQRTIENVTHLSKHVAPNHMVTIETDDGDELVVTPDHKIPVKGDDELIVDKKAHEIETGDQLFDYGTEKINEVQQYQEIDILKQLLQLDHDIPIENIMIRGIGKDRVYELFTEALKEDWEGRFYPLKSTVEYLGINKKTLSNYLYRDSVPLTVLTELYDDGEELRDLIPKDVNIGVKRDNVDSPRYVTIDEELATLIGYYTADGYNRRKKYANSDEESIVNQVDFAAMEEETREFIINTIDKKFNVSNPYTNDNRITASSTMIRFFFEDIINAGDNCYEKRVPCIIKESSDLIKGSYLNGYISGNGSNDGVKLSFLTTSKELNDDITSMLSDMEYKFKTHEIGEIYLRDAFPNFYELDDDSVSSEAYRTIIGQESSKHIVEKYNIHLSRKRGDYKKNYSTLKVINTEYIQNSSDVVYNLTVESTNMLQMSRKLSYQCDGDEDCVMLLMDSLLNFSRAYLPDQRGRNMMDAPIVMSAVIDPEEIDDEAHNVDIDNEHTERFYKQTLNAPKTDKTAVTIAEDVLDDPQNFNHVLETTKFDAGPKNTSYKNMGTMDDKTQSQLELAQRTRGIDERIVASSVVEKHFFPDIIGNLTAFSKQQVYCTGCKSKHRRAPASGICKTEGCDKTPNLTVYEGMVNKYLDMAQEISEEYNLDNYAKQRLEALSDRIDSLFNDDKYEQSEMSDFFK